MLRATIISLITLTAASASAEFVDFRDSAEFGGSDNGTTASFSTDSGANATITPGPQGASFYWGTDDGFGVRYTGTGAYEYDEIEGPESLSITFSQPVYIESVLVTDLYREQTNIGTTYNETGSYTLSNGTSGAITANGAGGVNGEQTVSIGAWASSIVFRGAGAVGGFLGFGTRNNEYSVAGITFGGPTAVPELDPSAAGAGLILLLGGLVVLGGRRRSTLAA